MRPTLWKATALAALLMTAGIALADGPFSLFGDADTVRAGNKGNPWAVRLTSLSYLKTDDYFAGVDFTPNKAMTFADLRQLSADVFFEKDDDCAGGSPRFQINVIDENG